MSACPCGKLKKIFSAFNCFKFSFNVRMKFLDHGPNFILKNCFCFALSDGLNSLPDPWFLELICNLISYGRISRHNLTARFSFEGFKFNSHIICNPGIRHDNLVA